MTTLAHLAAGAAAQRRGAWGSKDGRSPLLLSTGFVAIAASNNATPNMQQLVPPFRSPYLIREIRFTAQSPNYNQNLVAGGYANPTYPQGLIHARLSLGEKAITKNAISIASFAPSVQKQAEFSLGSYQAWGVNAERSYCMFKWVLPKPMWAQPGEGIIASFHRDADGHTGNCLIEMSVVGEVLPAGTPQPPYSCVPYVSDFVMSVPNYYANSQAFDLPNPWPDKNLYVQRLIGRCATFYPTTTVPPNNPIFFIGSGAQGPAHVMITDQDKFPITPASGSVAFPEAFDARTCALEHRRILPPGGWLQVTLQNPASSVNFATYVSMIGWRKEKLS